MVQRVRRACVTVSEEKIGEIGRGLVALIGVAQEDGPEDARYIAEKIAGLRIFPDEAGRMNRAVGEVGGAVLAVSQFTLLGDGRKGRRPSFTAAAPPDKAESLFQQVVGLLQSQGLPVAQGRFGAVMQVEMVNDGPVTILLDSRRLF